MIENVTGFGLIAIDKAGGRILFLDPATLKIRKAIADLPPKPHELLLLPHLDKAYVPIFGDGVHGKNPHPQHAIAVVDLRTQAVSKLIDLSPYESPHTARVGVDGLVYCCCENSGVVVVVDPRSDAMIGAIKIASVNTHRLATIPGRHRLITESEEDATLSLVEMKDGSGTVIKELKTPGPLNGIDAAPTRPWVVCSRGDKPELFVVDRDALTLAKTVPLVGHAKQGQIVRYRPDGELFAVIGDFDPVASFYDAEFNHLFTTEVGNKPLDGAFTPDGQTFLVANEESGTISVIDLQRGRTRLHADVPVGAEVLGYYPLRD